MITDKQVLLEYAAKAKQSKADAESADAQLALARANMAQLHALITSDLAIEAVNMLARRATEAWATADHHANALLEAAGNTHLPITVECDGSVLSIRTSPEGWTVATLDGTELLWSEDNRLGLLNTAYIVRDATKDAVAACRDKVSARSRRNELLELVGPFADKAIAMMSDDADNKVARMTEWENIFRRQCNEFIEEWPVEFEHLGHAMTITEDYATGLITLTLDGESFVV